MTGLDLAAVGAYASIVVGIGVLAARRGGSGELLLAGRNLPTGLVLASMVATELSDVLFKRPKPIRATVNFGVMKKEHVNILVHGHEPTLSEMLVAASQEPDVLEMAKAKGATGISLAGLCCTSNEILMRHGMSVAGNFLQQELAIATGVVDAMVVLCVHPLRDLQGYSGPDRCWWQRLPGQNVLYPGF